MRLFRKIVDSITNEVRYVKYFIEYIVDFSTKRSENDFIVRTNVDSHLDKCKLYLVSRNSWVGNNVPKNYVVAFAQPSKFYILCFHHKCAVHHVRGTLPETLTRMGEKDMKDHLPSSVTTCKMVYIPNIGYLLAIIGWNPSPADNADLENLEFKFVSNNIRYYKSPSAKGFFFIII